VNWKLIRLIDRWVGIPLLAVLRLATGLRSPLPAAFTGAPRRALFVKFWGIGNICMILPSIQSLKQQWPNIRVDFLTLEQNREALLATGVINDITTISTDSPWGFIASWKNAVTGLRGNRYDLIVDFEQFARFSAFVVRQIGAPMTVGFRTPGQFRHNLFTRSVMYDNDVHVTRSFHSLVQAAGVTFTEVSRFHMPTLFTLRERGRLLLARLNLGQEQQIILMHVGTSSNFQERRWLPERYADLADRLAEKLRARVIFTGMRDENHLIEKTLRHVRFPDLMLNLGGQLSFMDYFSLIASADLVISADTSAVHLASAVNTPVVGLYGPNTPRLYGPWGDHGWAVYTPPACSPCISNYNAKIHTCRHPDGRGACMAAISADSVFNLLREKFPRLFETPGKTGAEARQ
jgi:ADP-heptose:LPS heptosyltransferase